jgi:hypothetical protein
MKYRLFLGFFFILLAVSLKAQGAGTPEVHWTDERHALLSWTQEQAAEVCIGKIAHVNYILIGCGTFDAGPQELKLPPFPSGNDSEVWPRVGDVYLVGSERAAALGPPPKPRLTWLPLVAR